MAIDLSKIKTYSLRSRKSKVKLRDFAKAPKVGDGFIQFYNSLPNILAGRDFRSVVEAIILAHKKRKPVIFMLGAHVIKCGLNPIIIELMKKDIISCIVLNGAGMIHDFEIAYSGQTSEDVEKALKEGRFGMACQTAEFLNRAVSKGTAKGKGLGEAVAEAIKKENLPHKSLSLLYTAIQKKAPVTVHVAIGTDIIHQHPSFDAEATGLGTLRDFHKLVEIISKLEGGIVINFGSAVVLPEVFLKALNLARNLGNKVDKFTAANFDMLYHYRPLQNVVKRPTRKGGKGFYIIGHHEIMIPLLARAVIERLKTKK